MKKQRIFWIVCFLFFSIWVMPQHSQAETETSYRALIIGRGDYGGSRDLSPGPENDAENFRRVLDAAYGEEITITQKEKEGVTTTSGVQSAIQEAFQNSDADDVNYFYYSGHGNSSGLYLGSSTMTAASLAKAFEGISGTNILVIDCCYSGSLITKSGRSDTAGASSFSDVFVEQFMEALSSERKSRSALNTGNFHIITAASSEEQSWQGELGENGADIGLFTSSLALGSGVNPLKVTTEDVYETGVLPADYDRDGSITFNEIAQFLKNGIYSSNIRRYPENDDEVFLQAQPDKTPDVAVSKSWVTWEDGQRVLKLAYDAKEDGTLQCAAYRGALWNLSLLFRNVLDPSLPSYASSNIRRTGMWEREIQAGSHILTIPMPESDPMLTDGNYAVMVKGLGDNTYTYMLPCSLYGDEGTSQAQEAEVSADVAYFEIDGDKELCLFVDFGTGEEESLVRPYLSASIKDQSGSLVRSLAEYELADVVERYQDSYRYYRAFYWDGKDDGEGMVSPGLYQLQVVIHNGGGQEISMSEIVLAATEENPVTGIRIVRDPDKTEYEAGETFSADGMQVAAVTAQGDIIPIEDYQIEDLHPLTAEDYGVEISFGEWKAWVAIQVNAGAVLEIKTLPDKTEYLEGEAFDPQGLEVFVRYPDGSSQEVTDYEILNGTELSATDTEVTIQKDGLRAQVDIHVYACTGLEVTALPDKMVYTEGEIFDPSGLRVSLVYENGERRELNDWQAEEKRITATDAQVSIWFGNWQTKLSVTVLPASGQTGEEEGQKETSQQTQQPVQETPASEAKSDSTPVAEVQSIRVKAGGKSISGNKLVIGRGEKVKLSATVLPSNAEGKKVTYSSSNAKVASVKANGTITGKKKGTAKIKVTAANGKTVTIKVTVKKAPTKLIRKTGNKTIKKNKKFKIQTRLPSGTASYRLTYKSSKPKVASVNKNGVVTAKKKGTAVIMVRTYNNKKIKLKVKVK